MELCDQFLHKQIQLDPVMNDYLLDPTYKHLRSKIVNVHTSDYQQKEKKLYKTYLSKLQHKKHLTKYDLILQHDIQSYLQTCKFPMEVLPLTSIDNFYGDMMSDIKGEELYQFSDISSYQDYIRRLHMIPVITTTMIKNMKKGIRMNITTPRLIIQEVCHMLHHILVTNTPENQYNHCKKIPTKCKRQFLQAIETDFMTSVQRMLDFLQMTYIQACRTTIGLSSLPNGSTHYKKRLSSVTIKDTTPTQLHKYGYSELHRINQELRTLQTSMKFKGSLLSYKQHMNKSHHLTKADDIIQTLDSLQTKIIKKVHSKYFHGMIPHSQRYKIKTTGEEKDNSYAYYIGPDIHNKRKGTFYVNPKHINKHELAVLSLHEGIPGHHYQINYHNLNNKIPLYVKNTARA